MSENNKNQEPAKKFINRRTFISRFLIPIAAGFGIGTFIKDPVLDAIRTASVNNTLANNRQLLQATATAVAKKGEHTSPLPEGEITPEMVREIRKSVILVKVTGEKGEGTYTAWLAKRDKDILYFVTNRHCIEEPGKLKLLEMVRPGIDKNSFDYPGSEIKIATAPVDDPDIAVIKLKWFWPTDIDTPFKPLNYKENALIKNEDKLLSIGFPGEFVNYDDLQKSITSIDYLEITNSNDDYTWDAKGIVSPGNSGSPAIKLINHIPTVIGMASGVYSDILESGDKITPLQINGLIDSLK
jgi:hypothetical protein